MATSKNTTTKKKISVKKAPTKRAITNKKSAAKTTPRVRSFHVSPDIPAFSTFKITRQTVYWVVIVSFIIFMQLWILALQMETSTYIENQFSALETGA